MSLIFIMDRRDLASASVKSACGHAILRTTFAHSVTSIQDGNWQTEEIYHQYIKKHISSETSTANNLYMSLLQGLVFFLVKQKNPRKSAGSVG